GALLPLSVTLCVVLLWHPIQKTCKQIVRRFAPRGRELPAAIDCGQSGAAMAFVLPACLVFLLCCFFLFAPWDWDNTKLMLWAYLSLLPFLWSCLIRPCPGWARICLCGLLFWSGFISLLGGLKHAPFELARRSEID